MITRDSLSARILKHGLCAAALALLMVIALAMTQQVFERSVASIAFHEQGAGQFAMR